MTLKADLLRNIYNELNKSGLKEKDVTLKFGLIETNAFEQTTIKSSSREIIFIYKFTPREEFNKVTGHLYSQSNHIFIDLEKDILNDAVFFEKFYTNVVIDCNAKAVHYVAARIH